MLTEDSRRAAFPTLGSMTYLNTAAEGIPPLAVGEALGEYFRDKQLGMDGRDRHFAQWDAARSLVGAMYGLSADEIGICSTSSEAYNLAALALRLKPGDEVVINDLDFPAGATPWLQPDSPATVRVWRCVTSLMPMRWTWGFAPARYRYHGCEGIQILPSIERRRAISRSPAATSFAVGMNRAGGARAGFDRAARPFELQHHVRQGDVAFIRHVTDEHASSETVVGRAF